MLMTYLDELEVCSNKGVWLGEVQPFSSGP